MDPIQTVATIGGGAVVLLMVVVLYMTYFSLTRDVHSDPEGISPE